MFQVGKRFLDGQALATVKPCVNGKTKAQAKTPTSKPIFDPGLLWPWWAYAVFFTGCSCDCASVTDWEQWAAAHHYVVKHGEEAPIVIAIRADQLLERGEVLGANTYVAIMRKSEQLLNRDGGSVH